MKLGELALRKDRRLWVAIDDLGHHPATAATLMDREIRVFCDRFAAMMANPAFGQRFRLMLIQYPDGPTPTKWRSEVWTEDRPCEKPIEREHVVQFLAAWTQGRGQPQFEHDLETWAAEVVAEADAAPRSDEAPSARLQRLHDALVDRMRALERATP